VLPSEEKKQAGRQKGDGGRNKVNIVALPSRDAIATEKIKVRSAGKNQSKGGTGQKNPRGGRGEGK